MRFIKVTTLLSNTSVFVNAEMVVGAFTAEGRHYIKTAHTPEAYEIFETPEQILRQLGAWETSFQS